MTDFLFPLSEPPTPGPPDPGPTGWPVRTGRSAYGPTMRDDRPRVRPDQELDAATVELLWWQLAGQGRAAPLATLFNDPFAVESLVPRIRWGAFVWYQALVLNVPYASVPAALLTVTKNGTGDFSYVFPANVNGRDGLPHPLTILGAVATPCGVQDGAEDLVPLNVRCEVMITGSTVRVFSRQQPGTGTALVDAPHVVVVF